MKPEEKGAGKHQRVEGVDGQSGMTTENVTRAKGFWTLACSLVIREFRLYFCLSAIELLIVLARNSLKLHLNFTLTV